MISYTLMQATSWPSLITLKGGTAWEHSGTAMKQRGWKGQPGGGFNGLGTSPLRMMRSRVSSTNGSAMGMAESKALV